MSANDVSEQEEASLTADFASAQLESGSIVGVEDIEDDTPTPAKKGRPKKAVKQERNVFEEPAMSDPKWSEYAISKFEENELDPKGNPLVHGLRRVVRLLLGPIIYSGPAPGLPFQGPSFVPGLEKVGILNPTSVGYQVQILMCKTDHDNLPAYTATFADVADCYFGNTDPDYARHASATASTKAEARCLRKALQLRNVSSEETTHVPFDMSAMDGKIDANQVNFIQVLCSRNNVNLWKYVNAGKNRFSSIEDIPFGVAASMVETLSGFQNSGKVPENLRGYDKDWRNNPPRESAK